MKIEFKRWWTRLMVMAVGLVLIAAVGSQDFMAERRAFRGEIDNKIETRLDRSGTYSAVIFRSEAQTYNFKLSEADRARLTDHIRSYFACDDEGLLRRMVSELERGRYIIYKEYSDDGVNLKTVFLSPKAEYWKWLIDVNGIENLFHVYNFSVGIPSDDPNSMIGILQTEGSFFGITQAVSLPVLFTADEAKRTFSFRMPAQAEMTRAINQTPALDPARTRPEQKFIDLCRTHPYFQQTRRGGGFAVSDADIMKLYEDTVANIGDGCPVKESTGHWRIQEDYPFLVVDYSLKSRVNVMALIPRQLHFMAGSLEEVVQTVSDEVSVKYLPLSMKNFRDHTQEWTRTGGPKK